MQIEHLVFTLITILSDIPTNHGPLTLRSTFSLDHMLHSQNNSHLPTHESPYVICPLDGTQHLLPNQTLYKKPVLIICAPHTAETPLWIDCWCGKRSNALQNKLCYVFCFWNINLVLDQANAVLFVMMDRILEPMSR